MKASLRVFCLSFLLSAPAHAYEYNGAKWARSEMPIEYSVNNTLSGDLPDADALAAVREGYDVWNRLECSFMRWEYTGRTNNDRWQSGDGENVVTWRESGWGDSPTALAITSSIFNFQGNLQDTDIKFNGVNHQWANFENQPGFDPRTDIASVSAHEVGHALGLGHSNVRGSTMWPSTTNGDVSGRTLGQDDIAGACDIYPSGAPPDEPDPDPGPGGGGGGGGVEPPPEGTAMFGEDCTRERCAGELFCVSDGMSSYCTEDCDPAAEANPCPNGFYCAQLSGGGGACAEGQDPRENLADFGEDCGEQTACKSGLICVSDPEAGSYCTSGCQDGMCPDGFFCAQLQNGGDACAKGDGPNGGMPLPGFGEACTERGLCNDQLFCLNDSLNVDEQSGRAIPYCTMACPDGTCREGFRCVPVNPNGTACQKIPSAGRRELGDPCWVNPENPTEPPSCGGGDLVCVGAQTDPQTREVTDPGMCTINCNSENCCPDGWGCLGLLPTIGQCTEGVEDTGGLECAGERPDEGDIDNGVEEAPAGGEGAGGDGGDGPGVVTADEGGGGGGGCAAVAGPDPTPAAPLFLLAFLGLFRRRR